MSPRPAPSPVDATAQHFLAVAADLIDAYLQARPFSSNQAARLRAIRFPAAFEWIRKEDVIRLARATGKPGTSKQAWENRWATREEFIADAITYAIIRDEPNFVPSHHAGNISRVSTSSPAGEFIRIIDSILADLLPFPRTYLILHMAPLLPRYPLIHEKVVPNMRDAIQVFTTGYRAMLDNLGLTLRPGWPIERVALGLQAMLDGFLLRARIMPDEYATRWEGASIFSDTVIAFTLGVVDWDRSNKSSRATLDRLVANT